MQITCAHCAITFTTNHLDHDKGLADLSNQFSTHFNKHHVAEAKQMALDLRNLNMLSVWLVLMAKHTTLLDQSVDEQIKDPIMDKFTEVVDQIEDCLGIEVMDTKASDAEDGVGGSVLQNPIKPLVQL